MIGAILGDIIGSPYEFDRGNKSKDFPLFSRKSTYTDDSVMTLAVGLTFLDAQPSASDDWILRILTNRMRQFGKMYPNAGYGGMFRQWLRNPECKAYNSFGNGSAMRVSSVACLYNDMDAVRHAARLSAEVTHNHPEGNSFEDVIRTAVSLGGDCDTLTAIAGSIAEGFYGVPAELKEECYKRLPEPLLKVLKAFEEYLDRNAAMN